jgi:hypothetical protein
MRGREGFAEDITGHGHLAARAQRLLNIGHFDRAAEPARLEIGAEISELERHVGLALRKLLCDERRGAV